MTTLDGEQRTLSALNVLVCDEDGALSMAGVMGGAESEVTGSSRNILLEGAAWNFINIRRTSKEHNLPSEASFRFSRGVHPALADTGVKRGLEWMARWSGGVVAPGLVDEYPLKPKDPTILITPADVKRLLGISLSTQKIAELLTRLEFKCTIEAGKVKVKVPPFRLDIGEGITGQADVLEEVARIYGYDRIPAASMADALPPQVGNPVQEWEEHLRDVLVSQGFDEVVSYRLTSAEREAPFVKPGDYVHIANPIAPEKSVMRRSLLASVLDALEHNARLSDSLSFFEIGPIFEPRANDLPDEVRKLALAMTGLRSSEAWDAKDLSVLDFFDLKGEIELLLSSLRYTAVTYAPIESISYLHPGKAAEIKVHDQSVGIFGVLHPLAKEQYKLGEAPVLVAEIDLDALRRIPPTYEITPISEFPPVLEDIALILDESIPAARVEALIRQTGGRSVTAVHLFDVYRGEQIGAGKKSLAYSLTYQAENKTMTDAEAAAIRNKIVKRLEQELGAKLRS